MAFSVQSCESLRQCAKLTQRYGEEEEEDIIDVQNYGNCFKKGRALIEKVYFNLIRVYMVINSAGLLNISKRGALISLTFDH